MTEVAEPMPSGPSAAATMSIQERIKAMNNVIVEQQQQAAVAVTVDDNKKDHAVVSIGRSPSPSSLSPKKLTSGNDNKWITSNKRTDDSNSEDDEKTKNRTASSATSGFPKRSSVVEIWKKREGLINKSLVTTNNLPLSTPVDRAGASCNKEMTKSMPQSFAETDFHKFEEKKEEFAVASMNTRRDENKTVHHAVVVTPERSKVPYTGAAAALPIAPIAVAPRLSNVRDSWKKKAGSLQHSSFLPARDATKTGPLMSDKSKSNNVHLITPEKKISTSAGKNAPVEVDDNHTPNNVAAFDELKSKWAKFGVHNVQSEQSIDEMTISPPATPSAAVKPTPTTPSPQNKEDTPVHLPVHSESTEAVVEQTMPPAPAGGFLKRRTELPTQPEPSFAAECPQLSSPIRSTSRQNYLVKMGQKHASRPKSSTNINGKMTAKKGSSGTIISTCTKKALMARRMRSRKRTALDSTASSDKRFSGSVALSAPKQEVGFCSAPSNDSEQSASSCSTLENSTRPYTRVEPPESPFATTFERDFTLSISQSGSKDNTETVTLGSSSLRPEESFDPWPAFPDDEGPCTFATKSSESIEETSPSNTVSATQVEERLSPSSALLSRASQMLRESRRKQITELKAEDLSDRKVGKKAQPESMHLYNKNNTRNAALLTDEKQEDLQKDVPSPLPSPKPMYAPSIPTGPPSDFFSNDDNDESSTIVSEAASSVMQSTFASGMTSEATGFSETKRQTRGIYPFVELVSTNADDVVRDKFVAEKNASVASFANAYEKITFKQLAEDIREETNAVLDMEFWSKGMQSASDTIIKIVGNDLFQTKKTKQAPLRPVSPVEEVAVEVEFIAD